MELKDLLAYIGLEAEDMDKFKAEFSAKFIPKDQAPDEERIKTEITGRITGAFKTKFKSLFELDNEEISKFTKWEEILEYGSSKQKKALEELKLSSTNTDDTKIKELTEKLEKANLTTKEYKGSVEQLQELITKKDQEWSGKFTSYKADNLKKDAFMKVMPKLSDTLGKGDRLLLDTEVNKLQLEFDEEDNVIVKGSDGKRIPSPKKVGDFLGLEDAIELIAEREGLVKKNAGGAAPKVILGQQTQQPQQSSMQVHPSAQKAAEQAQK